MLRQPLIVIILISIAEVITLAQGPGPFYFVTDKVNKDQFYWREKQGYGGGATVHINFNLLAHLLGDQPTTQSGQRLVSPENYQYQGSSSLRVQPFVVQGSRGKQGLRPGSNLIRFLNDPLNGGKFNLSLPFKDPQVALSGQGSMLRTRPGAGDQRAWHGGIDFDYTGNTSFEFEIIAPADGTVISTNHRNGTMTIKHRGSNGREFLTVYAHLNPSTIPSNLRSVKRGQFLGKLKKNSDNYAHLHFGVAVKGPSGRINGRNIPALWYLIDPFGVYDYRRNSSSTSNYNYLPNNRMDRKVKGRKHAYAFLTDPPSGSLILEEDCVSFNPGNLRMINQGALKYKLMHGNHALFSFNNPNEGASALQKIKQYRMNKSCFVGRPNSDFNYLLVNGKSPKASHSPEDCVSFSPSTLKVVRNRNRTYGLRAGRTALFTFSKEQEAITAMTYISKYGFTKSCFIGRPDPSFHYMRR